MTTQDVRKWHCDRCGFDAEVRYGTEHNWMHMSQPHQPSIDRYTASKGLKGIGGDICPARARSLHDWWQQPTRQAVPAG
jgi:hypothetical protein